MLNSIRQNTANALMWLAWWLHPAKGSLAESVRREEHDRMLYGESFEIRTRVAPTAVFITRPTFEAQPKKAGIEEDLALALKIKKDLREAWDKLPSDGTSPCPDCGLKTTHPYPGCGCYGSKHGDRLNGAGGHINRWHHTCPPRP